MLTFKWNEGGYVVRRLPDGATFRLARGSFELLDGFSRGLSCEELVACGSDDAEKDQIRSALDTLREMNLIGEVSRSDAPPGGAWDRWGDAFQTFHAAARDVHFHSPVKEPMEFRDHIDGVTQETAPPVFKEYSDAPTQPLPRTHSMSLSLADAFASRRTHRDFHQEPVPIDSLSSVLHYTFAPLRFSHTVSWGTLPLKASASGGARHEAEAYVYCRLVTGVPQGIYHYNQRNHALELLTTEVTPEDVEDLTFNQGFCGDAAFVVFVTAVLERMTYKYRHPRAYRVLLHDVGHLGQTFLLAGTGLGLGCFCTAAFKDRAIEQKLGLDSDLEVATYILGAGKPLLDDFGLPLREREAELLRKTRKGECD